MKLKKLIFFSDTYITTSIKKNKRNKLKSFNN